MSARRNNNHYYTYLLPTTNYTLPRVCSTKKFQAANLAFTEHMWQIYDFALYPPISPIHHSFSQCVVTDLVNGNC